MIISAGSLFQLRKKVGNGWIVVCSAPIHFGAVTQSHGCKAVQWINKRKVFLTGGGHKKKFFAANRGDFAPITCAGFPAKTKTSGQWLYEWLDGPGFNTGFSCAKGMQIGYYATKPMPSDSRGTFIGFYSTFCHCGPNLPPHQLWRPWSVTVSFDLRIKSDKWCTAKFQPGILPS